MDDPVATSQLLDGRFNSVYWHLLWFLLAPVAYFLIAWIYRVVNGIEEPTWIEKQLGAAGEEASGLFGLLDMGNTPALNAAGLAIQDFPKRKPPVTVTRISELFKRYEAPWCIAGGWALDLHLGRQTREHADIEVAVLRRDQQALWEYLIGWQPQYVAKKGNGDSELHPWENGEPLGAPIHELHTRPIAADVHNLEVLLNEADGGDWVYRRDPRVRMPLEQAILHTEDGIPYLAPEIVLLYKSKNTADKDHDDFAAAMGSLSEVQLEWLGLAMGLAVPGHGWLERLEID